jgi:hypothetical protein
MLLDDALPHADFSERHSVALCAGPAEALAAARALTVREVPSMRWLMAVRSLGRTPLPAAQRVLDGFTAMGFASFADTEGELVVVGVGRFWRLEGGLRRVSAEDFAAFEEPGWAKVAFNFCAAGGELVTETRIQATDPRSRRSFGRYWRVIMPASALIRRDWLRAVRRRAEGPP